MKNIDLTKEELYQLIDKINGGYWDHQIVSSALRELMTEIELLLESRGGNKVEFKPEEWGL